MRAFVLFLLMIIGSALAFNQPHLKWKTVETDRCIIHYYDKTEPVVYAAWKIADEALLSLSKLYDYKPKSKVNIALADYDDFSNGFADYLSGSVMIWIPDSRFEMRGFNTWLRNVITHELTHIVTLECQRTSLFNITAKASIQSERSQILIQEPFAFQTPFPAWVVEGIAQLETSKMGNDCWDSRRDMVLRTAALNGTLLTLDQMGQFSHDAYGNEMVYNQGFSLIGFLDHQIGSDKLRQMYKLASEQKISVDEYIYRVGNKSIQEFYSEWVDSITKKYQNIKSEINHDSMEILWSKGYTNMLPRVSAKEKYAGWLTSSGDDANSTELVIRDRLSDRLIARIPKAHTAWDFRGDTTIYYVKSEQPDRNGCFVNNIFMKSIIHGDERKLTRNGRIYGMAASPVKNELACIRYGNSRYSIELFDLKTKTFKLLYQGIPGECIVDLSYDPSGSGRLVFSKLFQGKSRLFILETDYTVTPIGPAVAQEETPYWADDGRIYYSADYDGIYNIYSVSISADTTLKKHSSVIGGTFCPVKLKSGNLLVSNYQMSGYSIASFKPADDDVDRPVEKGCTFQDLPSTNSPVKIHSRPYEAKKLRSVKQISVALEHTKDAPIDIKADTSTTFFGGGLVSSSSDALGKNTSFWSISGGLLNETNMTSENFQSFWADGVSQMENMKSTVKQSQGNEYLKKITLNKTAHQILQFSKALNISTASNDSDLKPSSANVLYIAPGIGFENHSHAVSFGGQVSAALFPGQLPLINTGGFLNRDFTSDFSAGVNVEALLYGPLPISAQVPVYLRFQHLGKYNKQINYNYANLTYFELFGGPGYNLIPDESDDSILIGVSSLISGLAFQHGFLLGRSSSLVLFTSESLEKYDLSLSDPYGYLLGYSDLYFTSATGIEANFPIAGKINRGRYWYLDALFGKVGYTLYMRGNREFFNSTPDYELFTEPHWDDTKLRVGHFITGEISLGIYKHSNFFRTLALRLDYEILKDFSAFSLKLAF